MPSPWIMAALERLLPSQQSVFKLAWAATLIPLAAFGYLTWRALSLNNEVSTLATEQTQIEARLSELKAEVDQREAEVASLQAARNAALVDLQRGETASAEDRLIEAAMEPSTPAVVPPAGPPRRQALEQLFDRDASTRVKAYGALLPRFRDDESLIPELLAVARQNPGNANGIYNTIMVLSHMNRNALQSHSAEILAFAESQASAGPRVKARAQTLLQRLPPK